MLVWVVGTELSGEGWVGCVGGVRWRLVADGGLCFVESEREREWWW